MSALSDALAEKIQTELDASRKPRRVYSMLAGGYVDMPAPMTPAPRKDGGFEVEVTERDPAGRLLKLRITPM